MNFDAIHDILSDLDPEILLDAVTVARTLEVNDAGAAGFVEAITRKGQKPALVLSPSGVTFSCSCRRLADRPCMHAAALLVWVYQGASPALPLPPYPGMPKAQLMAWAEARGIAGVLVEESWRKKDFQFHADTESAVIDPRIIAGRGGFKDQIAAINALYRALDQFEVAKRHEVERIKSWHKAPGPVLEPFEAQLRELRETLRETLPPASDEVIADHRMETKRRPISVSTWLWTHPRCEGEVTVVAKPFSARCVCGREACLGVLDAVDAILDGLHNAERPPWVQQLDQALGTPTWRITLDSLKASRKAKHEDTQEMARVAIGFRVKLKETGPQVMPVACDRTARGRWSLKQLSWERALSVTDGTDPETLRTLAQLAAGAGADGTAALALRRLVGGRRVFVRTTKDLHVDVVEANTTLSVELQTPEMVVIRVVMGDVAYTPADAWGLMHRGMTGRILPILDEEGATLRLVHVPFQLEATVRRLHNADVHFPREAAKELLEYLMDLHADELRVDEVLTPDVIPADPRPVIRLLITPSRMLEVSVRIRAHATGTTYPPGEGPGQLCATSDGGSLVIVQRRFADEVGLAVATLETLELDHDQEHQTEPWTWLIEHQNDVLDLVAKLGDLGDRAILEWVNDEQFRVSKTATPGNLSISVGRMDRWLGIDGELEVGGHIVPLDDLLTAVSEDKRFVRVGEDAWVPVDQTLRAILARIGRLEKQRDASMDVDAQHLLALDSMVASGVRVAGDPWASWKVRRDELNTLDTSPPATFTGELRPYQQEGLTWLLRLNHLGLAGACLADDMGLGKTVQAITFMLRTAEQRPCLVIAPTSVGFNWVRELERFAPSLCVQRFRGARDRKLLPELGAGDVLVTSYDAVVHNEALFDTLTFDVCVIDEAQAVKNPRTRRAKAVTRLDAGFMLALTGTPIENNISELWSLFHVIAPGWLGAYASFRKQFVAKIEQTEALRTRAELAELIRPFVLRRLKSEVARDLPSREDITLEIELSEGERRLYNELRQAAVLEYQTKSKTETAQKSRFRLLAALTRLRQLACDVGLVHERSDVASSKVATLLELVYELRRSGHRALIYSTFRQLLRRVRDQLDEHEITYAYLDGETPVAKRQTEVDRFQAGEGDVFLLSLKAGGTGLNLTAADYVIHLDPWWNPAAEDQATDRAHRIGQTRPVTVYRFVAVDTIEQGIVEMHANKRELADAILAGTSTTASMPAEALFELLRSNQLSVS